MTAPGASPAALSAAPAASRSRLLAYAPWILRDYAMRQGPSTAIVILLVGFLTVLPLFHGAPATRMSDRISPEIAGRMLRALMAPLAFIGTFFATNGIVADDRKHGYFRFLFAKPVSPVRYYAATFLLYGLGLLGVTAVVLGLWAALVRPMFPVEAFAVVSIMYLAYGGLGFLLSAAWRFDWMSLATTLLLANVGWSVWGEAQGLRHWVLYVLPPVHRADHVYALVARDPGSAVQWSSIAWLAAYGLACFALGMVVIRKRPLAIA